MTSAGAGAAVSLPVRHVPLLRSHALRVALALLLLLASAWAAAGLLGQGEAWRALPFLLPTWLLAQLLTDTYRHKYAQRYLTYLLASHFKAAVVMALLLAPLPWLAGSWSPPAPLLWAAFGLFALGDLLLSLPSRREDLAPLQLAIAAPGKAEGPAASGPPASPVDSAAVLAKLPPELGEELAAFLRGHLPPSRGANDRLRAIDDKPRRGSPEEPPAGLLVGRLRVNDVRRLHQYLQYCAEAIEVGGYLAVRYLPLENLDAALRRRYPGWKYRPVAILHFLRYRALPKIPYIDRLYFWPGLSWIDDLTYSATRKRNRALAKAEMWGRLAYWGLDVVAESKGDGPLLLLAQKRGPPVQQKMPSYYLVAALEKIGLDGRTMRIHKVRSMYPFSEFLQKRIFEEHGLASTGKFQNDFRLTDYGKFIRRYWLDELPQIWDWLRGEIKLVGMRATSRQFLGLYPQELYDLYVQTKPGLVPPIFDERTGGFEQIVEVEMTYLRKYRDRPLRTDLEYFWRTFSDIVFRGIRSK